MTRIGFLAALAATLFGTRRTEASARAVQVTDCDCASAEQIASLEEQVRFLNGEMTRQHEGFLKLLLEIRDGMPPATPTTSD